ncbi:MAG: DUF2786 domain-containing protein [Aeromicrobium sp.]
MIDSDPILAKVRKLLTLAEDPAATPHEAEACTAKAIQLMADYGIDQALLAHDGPARHSVGDRVIRFEAPYARDKCALASTIAHRTRCRCVIIQKGHAVSLHIFGVEVDLMCVEILLTSLLLQGTRELGRTPIPWGAHTAAYRRTWWAGFSAAISRRLAETEHQSVGAADRGRSSDEMSASLVLADRSHEAESAMNAHYPSLRNAGRRRLSGGGSRDGYASGQKADLSRGRSIGQQEGRELTG